MKKIFLAINLSLKNLANNTARTFVTLTGIIISIAAIIVVVSAGESVRQYVLSEVEGFGGSTIQIEVRVPSGTEGQDYGASSVATYSSITSLTLEDGERIAKLDEVVAFTGGMLGQAIASYKDTRKQVTLYGVSSDVTKIDTNLKISEGSMFSKNDDNGLRQAVVLGSAAKETFFNGQRAVGEKIKIKGQAYKVVGVFEERGGSFGFSFDDMVYVPIQTLQKKILGVDHLSFLTVKVHDDAPLEPTAEKIREVLRDRHDIDDPKNDDFEVMSMKEAQETIDEIFGTMNILLFALASISLIVGGVGIMNVMFVAVEERMSEIGLRKALGARRVDILNQFLVESLVISVVGGLAGIAIGAALLGGILAILGVLGIEVVYGLTINTVLISVAFSAGAGLLFGVYPAWKAAKTSPVEAMRAE